MPFTIDKCELFRIKYITLLEGETFLSNKQEITFFEIKCIFFGKKENTISHTVEKCWRIIWKSKLRKYSASSPDEWAADL